MGGVVTQQVGRYGERVARAHLVACGWEVLACNWRSARPEIRGELDVVALDGDSLVAVEVKTRRATSTGHPLDAVTRVKVARLRHLAAAFAAQWRASGMPPPQELRVDVVSVIQPRRGAAVVEHVRGVG